MHPNKKRVSPAIVPNSHDNDDQIQWCLSTVIVMATHISTVINHSGCFPFLACSALKVSAAGLLPLSLLQAVLKGGDLTCATQHGLHIC